MNYNSIIFAETQRDAPGCCHVIYEDMKEDVVFEGINKLLSNVRDANPSNRYHMIGRSSFVCEDNIVKIHPSKNVLIIAGNFLTTAHTEISNSKEAHFSDELLRRLKENMGL